MNEVIINHNSITYQELIPKIIANNPKAVKARLMVLRLVDNSWNLTVDNFLRLISRRASHMSDGQVEELLTAVLNVPIQKIGHHGRELYPLTDKGNIKSLLRRSFRNAERKNGTETENFVGFNSNNEMAKWLVQGLAVVGLIAVAIVSLKGIKRLFKAI